MNQPMTSARRHCMLAVLLYGLLAGPCVLAQHGVGASPVGLWKTFGDDGRTPRGLVRIVDKNGELVGTLAGSLVPGENPDEKCAQCPGERRDKPYRGLVLIQGFKSQSATGEYSGGEILDPDSGTIYRATLRLEEKDTLVVRGYIAVPLFGRSQTWRRVE